MGASRVVRSPWDTPDGGSGRRARLAQGAPPGPLVLTIPEALVERIAARAAEIVLEQPGAQAGASGSPYLTVAEAAEYLRAKPQRVYDLLSARRLTRHKDGSRVLVDRAEVDAYLAGAKSPRVATLLPPRPQSRLNRRIEKPQRS